MSNKVTLMYSSGLDSLISYHWAKSNGYEPICVWVDLGHPYSDKEKQSIKKLEHIVPNIIMLDFKSLYPAIENRLTNQIIPSRNLLLAVIGGMFSNRIFINALDGEQNGKEHDKSERFFEDTTKLLSFLNEFFQRETIVESPFAAMSKSETITWALHNGLKVEDLFATTSCYSGDKQKCGKCLTCFKRWSAFYLNDIEEPGYEAHPLDEAYFNELLFKIPKAYAEQDYSRFTLKRIEEFYKLVEKIKKNNLRVIPSALLRGDHEEV